MRCKWSPSVEIRSHIMQPFIVGVFVEVVRMRKKNVLNFSAAILVANGTCKYCPAVFEKKLTLVLVEPKQSTHDFVNCQG